MNDRLKYVMDHEIKRRQCPDCLGIWFLFDHHGNIGTYRLGAVEPSACSRCRTIDEDLEKRSIFTSERWFSEDDL